jgi:hypothetical protein
VEAPKPPTFTFALHGFVSASFYTQTAVTGPSEGQQALWASAPLHTDKSVFGGDVRQSRFNFSVAGPKVFAGATPKAVLEIDFFQGFGAGSYGDVSLLNRMRLAYSELDWGSNRLAFGQANDLIFVIAPTSLSHIAFPFGYEAGNIGWRRPAIWGFHSTTSGDLKTEFAWEVGRAQWNDVAASVGANTPDPTKSPNGFNQGEASGVPAVEARLTVSKGSMATVAVTGHWNKVDLNGVGFSGGSTLQVVAGNVSAKLVLSQLTLQGTAFVGKNLAPLIANFLTFQPAGFTGDVHEWGAWGQAGFNFTKELSLWGFAGTDHPSEKDLIAMAGTSTAAFKTRNVTTAGMLQYRDGGYAFGLEWIHFLTRYHQPAGDTNTKASQFIASANYFF